MLSMDSWTKDILTSHRPGNLLRITIADQVIEGKVFFDDNHSRFRVVQGFDEVVFIPYDSLYRGGRVERLND